MIASLEDLERRVVALEQAAEHDRRAAIAHELYTILENLGADPQVLAVISSYGDTLDDKDILSLLKNYNETGKVLR
jgi:hypothetical protein